MNNDETMTTEAAAREHSLTLVIPVYNEAEGLRQHLDVILAQLAELPKNITANVLIVDDGSSDASAEIVQDMSAERDDLSLLVLNRNFGKEAALMAGLDHVDADAVIVMDSDLQHPPALLPKMLALWQEGVDVVEAVKVSRDTRSGPYRFLADRFYKIFDAMTGLNLHNHSDYKLLDRKVIEAYRALPERTRFFRGLVSWMQFPSAQIPFEEPARNLGSSKWGALRLLKLSWQSISSFSALPLQLVTLLGGVTFVVSLVFGAKAIYDKLSGQALDGFTTVILLLLIIGSVLMFSVGLLGNYVARIYDEIKARPHYLINRNKSRFTTGAMSDEPRNKE